MNTISANELKSRGVGTIDEALTAQSLKRTARFIKHHPDTEKTYGKALELLEANPHHPSLRLHWRQFLSALFFLLAPTTLRDTIN